MKYELEIMLILTNFEFFIPEIFLTVNLLLILIYSIVYVKKSNQGKFEYKISIRNLSVINLAITLFILIFIKFYLISSSVSLNGLLMINDWNFTIKIIVILSSIILLNIESKIVNYEYSILISLAVLGMMIILSSNDLIILYLGIELLSLTLYILATLNSSGELSTEAGLKYFIIGAVSSGLLLIGCALIYSNTGFTGYTELENLMLYENTTNQGIILIIISMMIKLAVAPFHMWAPDVYDGSPTIVTAFFAIVPKIALFGALVTLITGPFLSLVTSFQELLMISAGLSIIIGTFGALNQIKLKRLMAYSAISHMGFIFIGLSTISLNGLIATLIYFILYIFMTLLTFTIIINLAKFSANPLTLLIGLSRENPLLALSFTLSLLSIAGVPPLAGFLSKFYILNSALQNDMWVLTIVAILASMVSAFYYLQLIKLMWFKDSNIFYYKLLSDVTSKSFNKLNNTSSTIIAFSTFIVLTALINPTPWLVLSNQTILGFLI